MKCLNDTTPYDANTFYRQGHELIDQLSEFLRQTQNGDRPNVIPWDSPEKLLESWTDDFQSGPSDELTSLIGRVLAQSTNLQHSHYLGHQIASPLPVAALCDLVGSLLNNGMVVFEVGPAAIAIEKAVVSWMARCIGYGDNAGGVLTSGGSLGNFTALLAARQAKAGHDIWKEGMSGPLAILASEQSHYSIRKAAQMMGLGYDGVIPVETDLQFRMNPAALEKAYAKAERMGRKVFAVVGNCCSTATGSYDPLDQIADFCESRGLWFHADGAHGASALVSEKYKFLLKGIERADSVVWDAHKMLMMPALVTGVIFKNKISSYEAFSQNASYLYQGDAEHEWFNPGHRTFECTKRMMGLKVYVALKTLGTKYFDDFVTGTYDLTAQFAQMIDDASDFEYLIAPQSNIICFRYLSKGDIALNAVQAAIRLELLNDKMFYIVQTEVDGELWLRCTVINPYTTSEIILALLDKIRTIASSQV